MIETTMGSRIEQSRLAQGLSTRQLATRLGVKTVTVENWERDRSEPRPNKLMTLAGLLNAPVLWLLQGEDERPSVKYKARPFDETTSISQKLDRATAMQQELAALLLEATAEIKRLQRELDSEKDLAA